MLLRDHCPAIVEGAAVRVPQGTVLVGEAYQTGLALAQSRHGWILAQVAQFTCRKGRIRMCQHVVVRIQEIDITRVAQRLDAGLFAQVRQVRCKHADSADGSRAGPYRDGGH